MKPLRRSVALVALLLAGCTTETAVVRETTVPTVPITSTTTPSATTVTTTRPAPGLVKILMTKRVATPATIDTSTTVVETTTTAVAVVAAQQASPVGVQQANVPALPLPQAPPGPGATEPSLTLGTIEIPRIGLNKSLFEGITVPTLNRGPGHWPGTALPGAVGNVVVGGHRTSKGRPFRHLERLVPGDEVIFTSDTGRFVYHVVRTEVVTPDAMWIINQTEAYTATLFACHPVGSTRERIVVFLELSI